MTYEALLLSVQWLNSFVFDAGHMVVSIVMFPPTSFWGKPWRFRARLVLSQQALYCFNASFCILALSSMRVINPCVSHMPIACPPDSHTSLVGSTWALLLSVLCQSCFSHVALIHSSLVIIVMFPPTSFWGKPWRFRARLVLSQQALYCFRCFLLHIGRTNPCLVLV